MMPTLTRSGRILRTGLILCLLLAMNLGTGWAKAGCAESAVLNDSGNRNDPPVVDPVRKSDGYSIVLYDNRNGLPTSEANAIAQTAEGFIWIGSYAGLIRYDGNNFERIDSTTGIANVRCLYVDSLDRLWIGTNDSGIHLMSKGEVQVWNRSTGLRSDSIRAIAEDADGTIYIGEASGLSMIDAQMNLSSLADERIDGQTIRDLRLGIDGQIYGLTQDGDLFTIKDGALSFYLSHDECRVRGVQTVFPDPTRPGVVYLGAEDSRIYYGELERNFASMGIREIAPLSYVERLEYIDGNMWVCAGNGIGYLDSVGFHMLKNAPMNNSVGHVLTDHEGDLWFTSTRQGVMKIVPNQFTDLFDRYGLPAAVVNTTCVLDPYLFIGTDTGLIVMEDGKPVESLPLTSALSAAGTDLGTEDLIAYLDGVRIRSIIRDSQGRLWISTWRKHGLLMYDSGALTAYTTEDGLFSDQIRIVSERSDGSMLIANTGGVNVLDSGRVIESYGAQDGLVNREVLTAVEGFGQDIVLGTDGGGIFVIAPDGTRHIGREDGLSSDVVMRIKRSRNHDVFWIVTGNSIACMTPDYRVTTIRQFPYPNNFDLYENSRGDVWVLSSTGIFVVSSEELLANESIDPVFFGMFNGLPYVTTANSYSWLTGDGELYIAGSAGVIRVNIEKPFQDIGDLRVALPFIGVDDERVYPDETGSFSIPANVRKLTIYPFVFNYSLINPQVSYRLEGFDRKDTVLSRNDLSPVNYTNLPNGVYHFNMVVTDTIGKAEKAVSFQIIKGKESAIGTHGSIIVDATSLFFMAGILIYTALYRRRGRLDDRLFFAMILTNIALAVSDGLAYILEGRALPFTRALMTAGNIVFYTAFAVFPYLFVLYLDYRVYRRKDRLRKVKLLGALPCLLLLIVLLINLRTGWIFSIGEDCIYHSGPLNNVVFIPAFIYALPAMFLVCRINPRLVLLGVILIAIRIALGVWFREISSTALFYTFFLLCTHIHVLNQPFNEEAL